MIWLGYLLVPFLASMALTPLVKWIAIQLEIYAEMNERTVHKGKIARIGGVSIYVAFVLAMTIFTRDKGIDTMEQALMIGSCIIFIGGLVDDMLNLKPIYKIAFQVVAALVLIFYGRVSLDVIYLPLGITIDTGVISFLVTFVWIIGITNAINLIDGLDGLAGGVSTIILLVITAVSFIDQRSGDIGILSLILAGAILGFLVFNFHPASIFMGDCGALFLGYFISAISLMGFKSSTFITLGFPMLLLAVPIIDTLSAILRRKLSGKSFADADKNHFHHVLMRKFGHRDTVLIIYGITLAFGVGAYLYILNQTIGLIFIVLLFLIIELIIEKTNMISEKYHPLLGLRRRILKLFK